jgi:hypothetical protein
MRHYVRALLVFAGIVGLLSPAAAQVNLIQNGSFESNGGVGTSTFANWTVTDQAGGSGSWFVQTGTTSPLNGFTVAAPTNGAFAAMTDQTGPGAHVIIQSFVVPAGGVGSAILSFDWYVNNQSTGGFIINPGGLDYTLSPNQHARVDILTGTAAPFSTSPSDVLANVFITNPGDPSVSGYNTLSTNLTALLNSQAGNTLQLRFAEVDNQNFFVFGADNVSLLASVPEPATWALMSVSGVVVSVGYYWRRRRGQEKVRGWNPTA